MVVTNDIGTLTDIHPKNKQEVGRRLALLALAEDLWQGRAWSCEGPTYHAVAVEGAKMRVTFDHAAGTRPRATARTADMVRDPRRGRRFHQG